MGQSNLKYLSSARPDSQRKGLQVANATAIAFHQLLRPLRLARLNDFERFTRIMTLKSLPSLLVTANKHQDRALTLVFGSDGQVSLIGFVGGVTSQPLRTFTTSARSGPSTISLIPNLAVTTTSLSGASSLTPIPTSTSISPLGSSSYATSVNATDTDTNLPSIPTINYPTPTPTAVSNPKDHGVGAPFYLAIVLASISFIGCVSAFIAWWIRSRSRKHELELEDPWLHSDSTSDSDNPSTDNVDESGKGPQAPAETQIRPYYLPASIVRRSSSNLLAVPHTIPVSDDGTQPHGISRTALDIGHQTSHPTNDPRSQDLDPKKSTSAAPRPGAERLKSELSVQESTRTLGRLRVANRVPGDITSGDEGGMSMSRIQQTAGRSLDTNTGNATPATGGNTVRNGYVDPGGRPLGRQAGDLLEPPGPATTSWGRRTDTIAALRRTRRRSPESTVKSYNDPRYGGHLYSTPDKGPNDATRMPLVRNDQEEGRKIVPNPLPNSPHWANTFKSSFWQAVDAMTGNRSTDSESRAANVGSGSRFTPAPQRAASRRSSVSPIRTAGSQAQEVSPPDTSVVIREKLQRLTQPDFDGSLMRANVPGVPHIEERTVGEADSLFPRTPHPINNSSASIHQRHPDSLIADTGSLYSTDSAAARANLLKYGYGDRIPSTWSALGARRESQLDLTRLFLPLPRPITGPGFSSGPLSITPSQVTLQSSLLPDSVSMRAPLHSDRDMEGSDNNTLLSSKTGETGGHGETPIYSALSMSRNSTTQSAGRSTTDIGTASLQATASTTSSMLGRKKGVATRRKRPSPPARAPSTASSVQSVESGLSIREMAVRRALLERRKKVKAADSLKRREDREVA